MATLVTGGSQLEVEGKRPRIAIIDSGASSVILGRSFSSEIRRCNKEDLILGDTFVTAGGNTENCLGRTKDHLSFTIARGTRAETTITTPVIIADTDAYDVILGMDFLGPCFGYVDPLTEEFCWRADCHETQDMPKCLVKLPAKCRTASDRERRHGYMLGLVENAADLQDALLGDESMEEHLEEKVNFMEHTVSTTVPIKIPSTTVFATLSSPILTTNVSSVHRRHEAEARLNATLKKTIKPIPPRTKWIGDANYGAFPISTQLAALDPTSISEGLHVLDLFAGISCGGLRTILEAGYKVACYTSVEIDDISRTIARKTLSDLQLEYPGQLPDKAIRGFNKRLPQNIQFVGESELTDLVRNHGSVDFLCGGWECQSMSLAGKHLGMDDERFIPFLDMVRIVNFLQKNQLKKLLYLFENTYPGQPGQYPLIDETAKMIESFLGAPITIDAAGTGSAAHRVRLFWANWCAPEILQDAYPQNICPKPSLQDILHKDHQSTMPSNSPILPFVKHNKINQPRKCMPTLVSYPNSHAYRKRESGKPGEGQLWNKRTKKWEEPTINEREQMMGYNIDATKAAHVTVLQRTTRLGQAMDANTMRWFGAFLFSSQICTPKKETGGGFNVKRCKLAKRRQTRENSFDLNKMDDHHHQACAIVEQIISLEGSPSNESLGGG